jgi:hypothetical protein
MRALRALLLFAVALALAYVAGWGMPGTELSAPAGVAAGACMLLAVTPAQRQARKYTSEAHLWESTLN